MLKEFAIFTGDHFTAPIRALLATKLTGIHHVVIRKVEPDTTLEIEVEGIVIYKHHTVSSSDGAIKYAQRNHGRGAKFVGMKSNGQHVIWDIVPQA